MEHMIMQMLEVTMNSSNPKKHPLIYNEMEQNNNICLCYVPANTIHVPLLHHKNLAQTRPRPPPPPPLRSQWEGWKIYM